MPKKIKNEDELVKKPVALDDEEKVIDPEGILGDELIPGEVITDDEDEDGVALDDEEVDPFKDKWEE